jgi:hypothetical protein
MRQQQHDRSARLAATVGEQACIDGLKRALGVYQAPIAGAGGLQRHQRLDDLGGGDIAALVAAHAVGDGPQARLGAIQHPVFIDGAANAGVGAVDRAQGQPGFDGRRAHGRRSSAERA